MSTQQQSVISIALSQVGQHEGRDPNGSWNNHQHYATDLGMPNGVSWCCEFTYWVFWKAGLESLLPTKRTAWVPTLAQAFKDAGRWSEVPVVGAVPFFGGNGTIADLHHVGAVVVSLTADTVTTVEGNTNNTGAAQGDGVYQLTHQRRDPYVVGYGLPAYKEAPVTDPITFVDSALNFEADNWTVADCDTFITNVKRAGHSGFFYYISREPSKCMPRWAILRCIAGGLVGAGIFEDTEDNPKGGAAQGHADAAFTLAYQKNLGAPPGTAVLNAFDRNTYNPVIGSPERDYAEAFAGDMKGHYTPGGYGDRAVVDLACHEVKMLVQTWTKTGTAGVHIVQLVNNVIRKVTAPECDTNQIVHNFPCWKAVPVAPAIKPIPALPQSVVHTHNALRELAMVPASENAARLSHIHAAQAHIKESVA